MRAEKRGAQGGSLPRQTETDRGRRENDISFRDPLMENHREFIRPCLELRHSWRGMRRPTRGVGSSEVGSGCPQPGAGPEPPLAGVYRDLVRGQLAARGMFLYHSSHTKCSAPGKKVRFVAVSEGQPWDWPFPVSKSQLLPQEQTTGQSPATVSEKGTGRPRGGG